MSTIGQLEESRASLRLLILLSKYRKPIKLSDLYDEMRSSYGLGRRMTETALEVCVKQGLVERKVQRIGKNPMPSIFHQLTSKGRKASEIIIALDKILS